MRALKFGAVGIVNTALDVGLFSVLTLAVGIKATAPNVISYSTGKAMSFALNRAWTFRDRNRQRPWRRLGLFATGNLVGLALSTAVVASLVRAWGPLPAKAVSVGFTFAWNYVFANFIVFKPS